MGHSLAHHCGDNAPVIYPDGSSLILLAAPQYWPTYWVAKHRLDASYFKARMISNRLSEHAVHSTLLNNKQISHSRPWEHESNDLRDRLSTLIYHERIKVYVMDRIVYERVLSRKDNHLSVNCRTAFAQINGGDSSLESQRRELLMELSQILVYRRKDKLRKDDIYWSEDWFTRSMIVTGSVMVSFADSVAALANLGASVVVGIYDAQMYYAKTLHKLSQGEFEAVQRDVARLIGGHIDDINELEAKIKAGYDIIAPIMADDLCRQMLYDFLREYVDSTPEVGSATFKVEITLEVLLVIGTLGTGATVVAARMAQRVGQFSMRALELIVKFSRTLRQYNKRLTAESTPPVVRLPSSSGKTGKIKGVEKDKVESLPDTVPNNMQTVTVYRVDDSNFDPRISSDGSIPVITTKKGNERALFINIDQPQRAKQFAQVNRNGDATVTAVEADASILERLRSTAVHDLSADAAINPTAPLRVDINKAPDQFGLRTPEQIQILRDAIDPSTVRIIDPDDL